MTENEDLIQRITKLETKLEAIEQKTDCNSTTLKEIKETHLRLKTIIGSIFFVFTCIWAVITTFKEYILGWFR